MKIPKYRSKEYLVQKWVEEKLSQRKIAELNGVSLGTIEHWIKKNNLTRVRQKSNLITESNLFNNQDAMYNHLVGFIAADGHVQPKNKRVIILIHKKDRELLVSYVNYFNLPIKVYDYPSRNTCAVYIVSKTLVEDCVRLGMGKSNKTFNLEFPKNQTDFFYRFYLRGVLDGDGNIRKNGFRITTGSIPFIEGLIHFINNRFSTKYKMTFQKSSSIKGRVYPKLEINSKKALEIVKWIYSEEPSIGLQRKGNYARLITSK